MRKRTMATVLTCSLLLSMVAGCSSGSQNATGSTQAQETVQAGSAQAQPAGKPVTIKIAHMNADTHPVSIALLEFKKNVEADTNGGVIIDLYGNSVIGGENEVEQMVENGSMDASLLMGMGFWQGKDESLAIDEMPFLFTSAENARAAYDGEFGDEIKKRINGCSGLTVVNFWESGFRHYTNNIRPISKPEDMKGIKFRSYQGEYRIAMFETLGSTAVPMAFNELFTALQQKTVDGQENPLSTIVSSAFCEVQNYLSLSGHIYNTAPLVMNTDVWNSLGAENQEIITKRAAEASAQCRKLYDENEAGLLKACQDAGMEINEVDKETFKAALQPVWEKYKASNGDELITLAQKYEK